MNKIILIICLLPILSATSCNNDDDNNAQNPIDQLPPETQTGENTFGFIVNGEPINVTNTSHQTAIYQGGGLLIGAQKEINSSFTQINMFISETIIGEPIQADTSYILNTSSVPKGEYYNEAQNCFYYTSSNHNGLLKITHLDTENFVVSGTFEFQAKSDSCEEVINITNGRFDLQYIP